MRTKKKTRVSFSDDTNTIEVSLPKAWTELDADELHMAYAVMAHYHDEDCRLHFFRLLTGMSIGKRRGPYGEFLCSFTIDRKRIRTWVDCESVACWLDDLDWVFEPGSKPVRLPVVRKRHAVNAMLYDLSFGDYVRVENLYQGFVQSGDTKALSEIYTILYPGGKDQWQILSEVEVTNVLTWLIQAKNLFALQFPNLFKAGGSGEAPDMAEIMNNEIRALTGGDVSKEDMVLEVACWRALTELDFKAKEVDELKKLEAKTKKR